MKASFRRQRKGTSAAHNGRDFNLDKASHIDKDKVQDNSIMILLDGKAHRFKGHTEGQTLEQYERDRYAELYKEHIEQKQAHYRSKSQYKRAEEYTADKLYDGARTQPVESIYQIGSVEDGSVDTHTLEVVFMDFQKKIREQIPNYNKHVKVLSYCIHVDETTPHIHERSCFIAPDGSPSQKKALEALGFERPDLSKPESQHNCPIMAFTAKLRDIWYEVIQEHGIEIDTRPRERVKNKKPSEYIQEQAAKTQALQEELQAKIYAQDERARELGRKLRQAEKMQLEAEQELLTIKESKRQYAIYKKVKEQDNIIHQL